MARINYLHTLYLHIYTRNLPNMKLLRKVLRYIYLELFSYKGSVDPYILVFFILLFKKSKCPSSPFSSSPLSSSPSFSFPSSFFYFFFSSFIYFFLFFFTFSSFFVFLFSFVILLPLFFLPVEPFSLKALLDELKS